MRNFLIAAFALCSLGMNAQTEVSPYMPGTTEDGVTYFLPKTCLHVTVKTKRTTHFPGNFNKFAERYLRLDHVTTAPYDTWELTEMSVEPYGVADKSKAYTIKMKSKTSAPLVGLAPDGRLLSINTDAPELESLSVAAVGESTTTQMASSDFLSEEVLLAGSTSKMAELTADEIFDIRENRALLAKGQADFMPKDGDQLKLMLESLDKQEQGLLQLFKGYTTSEERVFVFDFQPGGEVKKNLLFRFSKHLGVVDADDLAGVPVSISVKDLKSLPAPVPSKGKKKEAEDLRYIVPGRAEVKMYVDNKETVSSVVPMSQFGYLEHLGGDLFNKQYSTKVILSPENGGIVKIDMDQPKK